MGESGTVAYLFRQRGVITLAKSERSTDAAELAIIESGAEDYETTDEGFIVYTDPKALQLVKEALEAAGFTIEAAEQRFEPNQTVPITDEKTAAQILRIMDALEDLDDVSNVTSNFDIDETILNTLN
jgi:transcriptional/translational regulatory protein YebC/TACO1